MTYIVYNKQEATKTGGWYCRHLWHMMYAVYLQYNKQDERVYSIVVIIAHDECRVVRDAAVPTQTIK